ncbi:unnamed protein product, partial [Iphiclides podalirius]
MALVLRKTCLPKNVTVLRNIKRTNVTSSGRRIAPALAAPAGDASLTVPWCKSRVAKPIGGDYVGARHYGDKKEEEKKDAQTCQNQNCPHCAGDPNSLPALRPVRPMRAVWTVWTMWALRTVPFPVPVRTLRTLWTLWTLRTLWTLWTLWTLRTLWTLWTLPTVRTVRPLRPVWSLRPLRPVRALRTMWTMWTLPAMWAVPMPLSVPGESPAEEMRAQRLPPMRRPSWYGYGDWHYRRNRLYDRRENYTRKLEKAY